MYQWTKISIEHGSSTIMHCAKRVSTNQNTQKRRWGFFYQPIKTLKTGLISGMWRHIAVVYTLNYLVSHGVVAHEPSTTLRTVHYQRPTHEGRLLCCTNQVERETPWSNISTSQTIAACLWSEHKIIVAIIVWELLWRVFGWSFMNKYMGPHISVLSYRKFIHVKFVPLQ